MTVRTGLNQRKRNILNRGFGGSDRHILHPLPPKAPLVTPSGCQNGCQTDSGRFPRKMGFVREN